MYTHLFVQTADAKAICDSPNAGGGSENSEAMSFEVLRRCFNAKLVKTEMEIEYEWSTSKKVTVSPTSFVCLFFCFLFCFVVLFCFYFETRQSFDLEA